MISYLILIVYTSFIFDFLIWPVRSEASTGNQIQKTGFFRSVFLVGSFIVNLGFYLSPLALVVVHFPYNIESVPIFILSLVLSIGGRIMSLIGSRLLHRSPSRLHIDSVFRLSRNPISTGVHITFLGLIIPMLNWWMVVLYLYVLIDMDLKIKKEEKYTLEKFGDEYEHYRQRVPRYMLL